MGRLIDLTGRRFTRLVVLERDRNDKQGKPMWKCRCDCGTEVVVRGAALVAGHTHSCGCYGVDVHTTHGGFGTRLYSVWRNMCSRCNTPTDKAFPSYGGRGISVCTEWLDFTVFRKWAFENGYDENASKWEKTLDRIDNNNGYCPDNCRWVDMREQNRNKRNNRFVEINGKKCTIAEGAEILGMKYQTLYAHATR